MADHFPKGSVIRRVNLEPALLFGAGRALMLQLAHPAVAQGVEDHSDFKANPFKRLLGTLESVGAVVFGSQELAEGVGRRIHWIHEFVVGPTYRANVPENLLWVHATLLDTALRCHTSLVGELLPAEAETYYQEMKHVAEIFGVATEDQPATLADFDRYFEDMVASLEVSDVARDLAGFIVRPTLPLGLHVPLAPLLALQRWFTVGTTPPAIREQLGLAWDDAAERRFERAQGAVRRVFRVTPRPVRVGGNLVLNQMLLWQAGRHVRQFDEKQHARAARPTAA